MAKNCNDIQGSPEDEDVIQSEEALMVSPTASQFGESFTSIFRWRKSCFKLIWKQVFIDTIVYLTVALIYNYLLDSNAQGIFDSVANYFANCITTLPVIMFIFFVLTMCIAAGRHFNTVKNIPCTSKVIGLFMDSLKEDAPDGRIRLNQYIRYVLLFWLLDLSIVCEPLRRKYPNLLAVQTKLGLLRKDERWILEKHKMTPGGKKTVPLVVFDWLRALLQDTSVNDRFVNGTSDFYRNLDAVQSLKKNGSNIIKSTLQNNPIIVQTVTIFIHLYGAVTIFGYQCNEKDQITSFLNGYLHLPFALLFFFHYLWLKVDRIAIAPFGDDDDDMNIVGTYQENVANAIRVRSTYAVPIDLLIPRPQLDALRAN